MLDDRMHGADEIGIGLELWRFMPATAAREGEEKFERHDNEIERKQQTGEDRGGLQRHFRLLSAR